MIHLRLPYFKYLAAVMREAYSNKEDVIIDSIFCGELIADAEEQADLEDKNRRLNNENDDLYERTQRLEREVTDLEDEVWNLREDRKKLSKENDELEKKVKHLTVSNDVMKSLLDKARENASSVPVYRFAGSIVTVDEASTTETLYNDRQSSTWVVDRGAC